MKEIKEDKNRKIYNGRIIIVKMVILSKAIYKFNAIPVKLSGIFHRTRTIFLFLHLYGNTKEPQIGKAILRRKNNGAREIRLQNFRLYYKATVIKTAQNHINMINERG